MHLNPTVILTGASRGVGLSTLRFLLQANCNVLALSRSVSPALQALQLEYTDALLLVQGDVNTSAQSSVLAAVKRWGRIDSLVLNAGTLDPLGTTASMADPARFEAYQKLFATNYFSLVSMIAHALPHLNAEKGVEGPRGRIVLVSSGAATKGVAGWGAYSASKAAMNSLARTLGSEEPAIVTVAVRPGVVDTDMQVAIRDTGLAHMAASDHATFSALKTNGALLRPEQPAVVLAGLARLAVQSLSGTFVSWDDEGMAQYQ